MLRRTKDTAVYGQDGLCILWVNVNLLLEFRVVTLYFHLVSPGLGLIGLPRTVSYVSMTSRFVPIWQTLHAEVVRFRKSRSFTITAVTLNLGTFLVIISYQITFFEIILITQVIVCIIGGNPIYCFIFVDYRRPIGISSAIIIICLKYRNQASLLLINMVYAIHTARTCGKHTRCHTYLRRI